MKTLAYSWKLVVLALFLTAITGCRCSAPGANSSEASADSSGSTTPPSASPGSSAHAPDRAPAKGLWWKVTSGDATAYLFGSLHIARSDLYPLDPRIERAFDSADALVLEVDLTRINPVDLPMKMARAAQYPPGDSLEQHVDAETMKLLEQHAPGGLMSASRLRRFRPWFVATTVLITKLQALGYDPRHGLDRHFADQAEGTKEIIGLETVEEQLALFNRMPQDLQALMLEQTLEDVEDIEPVMDDVSEAWRRGDPKPIERDMMGTLQEPKYEPVLEELFLARNRRWVEELARYLETDRTYFVVVGAGHLVGKGSVIDLLQSRDYIVTEQ